MTSNAADFPHQVDPTGTSRQPALLSGLLLGANSKLSPVILGPRWFGHKHRLKMEAERQRTAWGTTQSVNKSREAYLSTYETE